MSSSTPIPLVALTIATALSAHGLRKKSLSPSGAVAAFAVGLLMMSIPQFRAPGITMIVFYLLGSRATKVGKATKGKLEEGHAEAGYRDASQVLCNSLTAVLATSLWAVKFSPQSIHSLIFRTILPNQYASIAGPEFDPTEWCALSPSVADGLSRTLVLVILGHFATCLGDTLASELGVLSSSSPRLITTFRKVPPGTNGGMSLLGTACSIAGGTVVGITMGLALGFENAACVPSNKPGVGGPLWMLMVWGAFAGGLGSGIDSLLGATIQRTRYSSKSNLILQDHSKFSSNEADDIKVISGWNILTNNQVNLVSSALTAAILGWVA